MHLRFCLFVYCVDLLHSKRGVCTAPMGGWNSFNGMKERGVRLRNHHW